MTTRKKAVATKKTTQKARWKNRIVGQAMVPADKLKANPKNWRMHGDKQRAVMDGVLDDIGWVQRVIVNKTTGNIVDGHLRYEQALKKKESVPVVYVELSRSEEKQMLALIDPISAMADTDQDMLDTVIQSIKTENDVINETLKNLSKSDSDEKKERDTQEYREVFEIVIVCDGEEHQEKLYNELSSKGLNCKILSM